MIDFYYYSGEQNFGDMLSPIIIEWISNDKVNLVTGNTQNKLISTGSIMFALREGDMVWGTGSMFDQRIIAPKNVTFLSVRGPLTRTLITNADVPEVYGDPALLMPQIYTPKVLARRYKIGVIPHYIDKKYFNVKDKDILNIDVEDKNVYRIIDFINSCDTIVSTSLHGIIVAEAYGIPTVWLKIGDRIRGGNFKFNDYFLSTGRDFQKPVTEYTRITQKEIFTISNRILPTPTIDTQPMVDAWNNHFKK